MGRGAEEEGPRRLGAGRLGSRLPAAPVLRPAPVTFSRGHLRCTVTVWLRHAPALRRPSREWPWALPTPATQRRLGTWVEGCSGWACACDVLSCQLLGLRCHRFNTHSLACCTAQSPHQYLVPGSPYWVFPERLGRAQLVCSHQEQAVTPAVLPPCWRQGLTHSHRERPLERKGTQVTAPVTRSQGHLSPKEAGLSW